jgi:acetyl esterase/lipase
VKTLPARAPAGSVSIEAIRAYFVDRKSNLNASGLLPSTDSLVIKNDSVLSRDGYAIPIRTYRPKNPPARGSPLVVFVHGGGFCVGNLDTEELNCQLFAAELGCVCVNPDYRLAPENLFPAAVLDCWDVLKWVRLSLFLILNELAIR